jgi:hypothetical protein
MGGACSTHGRIEEDNKILAERLKARGHSEDVAVDINIILE